MANNRVSDRYSRDVKNIVDSKKHSSEELRKLKGKGLSTKELKSLAKQTKYCSTEKFGKAPESRDSLIKQNLRLVIKVAKEYHTITGLGGKVDLDDVISAGNMGLVEAANRYTDSTIEKKYTREAKFSSYAYFWIKKRVLEELNINSKEIKYKVRDAYSGGNKDHRFYSKDDVMTSGSGDSAESMINNELVSGSRPDALLEYEEELEERKAILTKMLRPLSKKDRTIIAARYGFPPYDQPMSATDIAKMFGFGKSAVSTAVGRATNKMYHSLNDKEKKALNMQALMGGVDMRELLCLANDTGDGSYD